MDRRSFLKRGAVGASGVVAAGRLPDAVAAEEPTRRRPPLSDDDMTAYVARVDAGVERMSRWPFFESFPEIVAPTPEGAELGRKAVHVLYLTGMFGDLPPENQLDPRMQDRLWEAQPLMDSALDEMTAFLAGQTPETLSRVRSTLAERPEVLRGIIETLDREAAASGASEARRDQLRTMFQEVGWRMEKQPPELLIHEYRGKVERATAADVESQARQRWMRARVGEDAFWQAQESLRQRRISRGLKAMGIGALLFLAGVALVSAGDDSGDGDALTWIGLVPGITGGSVLFVVGLVMVLVGAATPEDAT